MAYTVRRQRQPHADLPALGHHFGEDMTCSRCSMDYATHQQRKRSCPHADRSKYLKKPTDKG